jgi:hypothetical protein
VDEQPPDSSGEEPGFDIDTSAAHPARLHNYLAGGDDHFSADRDLAQHMSEAMPRGLETARANLQALVDFQVRAVEHLVELGIRQFLAFGVPVPTENEIHAVAQKDAPESRVVYMSNDPVVLARAHELRRSSSPEGAAAYVHGSLLDVQGVLQEAGQTLDLAQPVAVLLIGTLNLVPDDQGPYGLVAELMGAVPPGSYLVMAHTTSDIPAEGLVEAAERLAEAFGGTHVVRRHGEILRFFDGLEVLDPGLVQIDQWHPDAQQPLPEPDRLIPVYGGVARKP